MTRRRPLNPNAKIALDEMKYEIANELGITNTPDYNGNMTSRQNGLFGGYVGGNMTRKLVEMGEKELIDRNKRY
ncbi:alpha/beta-type small acid-soluble spore protein [Caldisalinibacter kiritimatiensis]|uniref:Small acid-soluble spore protein n=1 Tax=Caldisalinibacter kiritimatiensis TaxID=1304284 RepID=R1CPT8_9FIRM|nr:alpha/beta-type small acid-soluble spore protein [Caldisalinibacter kiritimatiensis]EOD00691.1 small acid-soluble spore protein [Caldisalinibacter kiritimatiensis]